MLRGICLTTALALFVAAGAGAPVYAAGSAPLGCLAVYNAAPPDAFYPIPCHTVGPVAYFNGFGLFQGGRVECPVNLQTFLVSVRSK
ncbi:MAG: hypothetical protein ABIQ99_04435 [Thermoflexales bacterium]